MYFCRAKNFENMNVISRKYYAEKIDAWLGKEQVVVLVGQRRIGKSYILKDFILRHQKDSDANIIFIDKEKREFDEIQDYRQLNDYLAQRMDANKHNYILIDEIQDISDWERSIRSYRSEPNTDIIITGSNAKMLSSDLSTLLAGRYQEIKVHGLSYNEFLEFHQLDDSDEALQKYLFYGGLPGLRIVGIENTENIAEYLQSVLNTIILKDVIERHSIRNVTFFNNLLHFIADNIGKPFSANNISKAMKAQNQDFSTNVVLAYSSYLSEAYLLHQVSRYDIHGKKIFESNGKFYFEDVGIRNILNGGNHSDDIEKIIENVVFQELLRLGYDVKVGSLRAGEIDFVCTKMSQRIYVQVAYIIASKETNQREFGQLAKIADNYPKYVISMTPLVEQSNYNGITHIGLRKFLKNGLS